MWLPIALADILNMLLVVSQRALGIAGEAKTLDRHEILRSWMLPVMAEAIEADEEERKAFEMLESIRNLGKAKNE